MPYTPIGLQDRDPNYAASAANVESWLQNVYNQAVTDAPGSGTGLDWVDVTANGVTAGGAAATNTAAMNAIIDGLPQYSVVYIPAGVYDFNAPFNEIASRSGLQNCTFMGAGKGATWLRMSASTTNGNFFTIGSTTGTQTSRVMIRDMGFQCLNSAPLGAHHVFDVFQTSNLTIENIYLQDVPGFIKIGDSAADTRNSHGYFINNIVGTISDSAGTFILLRRAASGIFQNMELHVAATSRGIPVHIQPINGTADATSAGVEPVRFTNCSLWSPGNSYVVTGTVPANPPSSQRTITNVNTLNIDDNMGISGPRIPANTYVVSKTGSGPGGTVTISRDPEVGAASSESLTFSGGSPRCVLIDHTNGSGNNIWFTDCDFDSATVACIDITASTSTGATYATRAAQVKMQNCYLGFGNRGPAVRILNNGPGPSINHHFTGCSMGSLYGTVVNVQGGSPGAVSNIRFEDCEVVDSNNAIVKGAGMTFSESGFTVSGCRFYGRDSQGNEVPSAFQYAVRTAADVSDYHVHDNTALTLSTSPPTFFDHFAYANQNHSSLARIVHDNWPEDSPIIASAATINIPPHAHMATITGTTTINNINGPANRPITLKFQTTCSVSEAGNMNLAGAFTAGIGDTLTLITDAGVNWWEISRSNN